MWFAKSLVCFVTALLMSAATPVLAGPASGGAKTFKKENGKEPKVVSTSVLLTPKALSVLELEHSRARDELSAVESRLNLLSKKLYDSELVVDYRGELDKPFNLHQIELFLDGRPCYRKVFDHAPTVQALRLLDMFLPPGRHVVEIRVRVYGPDDTDNSLPGYFSGSSISAHLRKGATTKVTFNSQLDGDPPSAKELQQNEVENEWNIEITANSVTEKND